MQRNVFALIFTLFGAASALFAAQAATAQRTPQDAVIEEIIVTATKRSQSVQDVAGAVVALGADQLEDLGVDDVEELSLNVPNLSVGKYDGATLVSIRGVGSIVESGVAEPAVAMYVDGAFLPRQTMPFLRAVDLERVEVLRGPQGTLYGRNATGGAINYVSAAPSKEFESGITVTSGERSQFGVSAYVSGALSDSLRVRLSGGVEEQDGYTKVFNTGQELGGVDAKFFRGAIQIQLSEDLTIDAAIRYEENDAAVAYHNLTTPLPFAPPSLQFVGENGILADQPFRGDVETLIGTLRVAYDLSDNVTLRSITSYVDHDNRNTFDADGTLLDFYNVQVSPLGFDRPSESFAQEINLIGSSDNVEWILGLYYFKDESGQAIPVRLGPVGAAAFGLPAGTILGQSYTKDSEAWAVFADVTYSFTDRFRLNLGARYNDDEFSGTQFWSITNVASAQVDVGDSESKFLPKVRFEYDFKDRILGYAQWSQGWKSGGINQPGGGGELLGQVYAPEEIGAFEVGLKTESESGDMILNLAAFYYDYEGQHITRVIPPAVNVVNNADSKIYGAEADVIWRPTDAFTVNGGVTLTNARFDDFSSFDQATQMTADLDNEPLPRAPDFTALLGIAYEFNLGGELLSSLTLRGNVFYSDDVVLRYYGQPNDSQEAYTVVNLSATVANATRNIRLRLFLDNVTDEIYKVNASHFGTGAHYAVFSAPQTWGIELSMDF